MLALRSAALCVLLFFISHAWAIDAVKSLRYVFLSNGRVAGSEVDVYSPDGHIDCTYEFNDRGRGPKIAAHYQVGSDGLPLRVDETGNDYLKAPVDEHFVMEGGVARWKSSSENGQATAPGFYISNAGADAETALLVSVLLKARSGSVKLFPAGEARLEIRCFMPRISSIGLGGHRGWTKTHLQLASRFDHSSCTV